MTWAVPVPAYLSVQLLRQELGIRRRLSQLLNGTVKQAPVVGHERLSLAPRPHAIRCPSQDAQKESSQEALSSSMEPPASGHAALNIHGQTVSMVTSHDPATHQHLCFCLSSGLGHLGLAAAYRIPRRERKLRPQFFEADMNSCQCGGHACPGSYLALWLPVAHYPLPGSLAAAYIPASFRTSRSSTLPSVIGAGSFRAEDDAAAALRRRHAGLAPLPDPRVGATSTALRGLVCSRILPRSGKIFRHWRSYLEVILHDLMGF